MLCGIGASAPVPARQFHQAGMGASAPDSAQCTMTWGSASADRSIIASKLLLRTPVPRPTGQDTRPTGQGRRRASAYRELRSTVYGKRRPSWHRAYDFTGARLTELFGAPRARPHRDREPGAFRRTRPPTPPGTGNRTSSEARHPTSDPGQGTGPLRRHGTPPRNGHVHGLVGKEPRPPRHGKRSSSEPRVHGLGGVRQTAPLGAPRAGLHGTGQTAPLGAPRAPAHRDREPDAPRSIGPPTPPGTGNQARFGAPGPPPRTGTGNRTSSEARHPTPPGQDLVAAWEPRPRGRQAARFGAPRAAPHRDQASGAPRGIARQDSSGTGHRAPRSTAPPPTGAGNRTSSEDRHPRIGSGRDSSTAQATGAPRSPARQERAGTRTSSEAPDPHSTGRWHPTPRGRATGDSRVGTTRCTSPASAAWRSAKDSASAGPRTGQDGNDRKATAAVMRYGCWRGEVFVGCEPRRGN